MSHISQLLLVGHGPLPTLLVIQKQAKLHVLRVHMFLVSKKACPGTARTALLHGGVLLRMRIGTPQSA